MGNGPIVMFSMHYIHYTQIVLEQQLYGKVRKKVKVSSRGSCYGVNQKGMLLRNHVARR